MKPSALPEAAPSKTGASIPMGVPGWLKWAYTAFMMVLVPVYWANCGPTNFIYFCDAALFLTLFAVWTDNALLPADASRAGPIDQRPSRPATIMNLIAEIEAARRQVLTEGLTKEWEG